jgi:anti-sigma factor RsiW
MMATSTKKLNREPDEIELLLPWYATGTLSARDTRRVDEALARDPELARQYAVIREEYAETIDLNECLGAPSSRAMQKLFAAIDAEPAPTPRTSFDIAAFFTGLFARLSPRTLAWSASLAALLLLLQAGVIGAILSSNRATFETASLSTNEPITRDLAAAALPRALVRFVPEARVADITALLEKYQASIIEGAKGGMFKLQFGDRSMSKDEFAGLMSRLQNEKIVSLAVATP